MSNLKRDSRIFSKPVGRWGIGLAISLGLTSGAVAFYSLLRVQTEPQSSTAALAEEAPPVVAVSALGRLEPEGEVIFLSAPTDIGRARVEQLLIMEGERVETDQIVALLDGHQRSATALQQAKDQIQIAQARLAQVMAGAKAGDLGAQRAAIARLESELANADLELARSQLLFSRGAISASERDTKRLVMETTRKQLIQAQATLESIAEVRSVDVQLAQAELDSAITAVEQAEADLELTYIRTPIDGQVLKIHAKAGETIGDEGVAELGETGRMYVVGEVYETDIEKVKAGQSAVITSSAFTGEILGTVSRVGFQVSQQSAFSVNPGADTDRKVIEVKIQIADPVDSQRVAGLTNLRVEVLIQI